MFRHLSIGLLIAFGGTHLSAQNGVRISGMQQPSVSMQHGGGFPITSGRRGLIDLRGTPFHDTARRRGHGTNSFFYGGWPYWSSDYYEGSYEPEAALQPTTPPETAVREVRQEPVPSAVLLELQGDQWVKVSAFATATPTRPPVVPPAAGKLPPAIIIYRDGRSEELSSYSIIGTTLYTKADYLTTGAWTRKVLLADLDLPATIKQNQERGLKFDLPSGPNEVVLRP